MGEGEIRAIAAIGDGARIADGDPAQVVLIGDDGVEPLQLVIAGGRRIQLPDIKAESSSQAFAALRAVSEIGDGSEIDGIITLRKDISAIEIAIEEKALILRGKECGEGNCDAKGKKAEELSSPSFWCGSTE